MTDTFEKPLGKRARSRIERPREILAAALEEFISKGFAAARVEDIAAEVGVTKGTVYFYFPSKDDLFAQTIRTFGPYPEQMSDRLDRTQPAWPQLDAHLTRIFDLVATEDGSRKVFHLLISEGRHFPDLVDSYFDEFLAPSITYLRALLDYGTETGEFDRDALPMAEMVFSSAILANVWTSVFHPRRPLDLDRIASDTKRMLRRSLGR